MRILSVGTFTLNFLFRSSYGSSVELTEANFNATALRGGKNAFVKFHAPWCGHCRSIKDAWDKLGEVHKDSKSVLIGEVDCTSEDGGEKLCKRLGVGSFPTLMAYTRDTGDAGHPYMFGRQFDELDRYVRTDLVRYTWCKAKTKENCNDEQVAYLTEQESRSKEEWSAELKRIKEVKKYGTPYVPNPDFTECGVIDPGPQCNPMQTPDLKPEEAFQCCNSLGDGCKGFLYVSPDAQKARDGDDKASVYFCKGDADFMKIPRGADSAIVYVKPAPENELPESKPEAKIWLLQRIEMLESLLEEPPKKDEKTTEL